VLDRARLRTFFPAEPDRCRAVINGTERKKRRCPIGTLAIIVFGELIRAAGEKQPPSDKIAREKCIPAAEWPRESFPSSTLPAPVPILLAVILGLRFMYFIRNASRLGSPDWNSALEKSRNRDEIREAVQSQQSFFFFFFFFFFFLWTRKTSILMSRSNILAEFVFDVHFERNAWSLIYDIVIWTLIYVYILTIRCHILWFRVMY